MRYSWQWGTWHCLCHCRACWRQGLHVAVPRSVPSTSCYGSLPPLLQHINPVAASLIQKMLQTDPTARPTIHELLEDEFFTSGYIPARLPITCLTIPPRFSIAPSSLDPSSRKPLSVLNKGKVGPEEIAAPRGHLGFSGVGGWPQISGAVGQALLLEAAAPSCCGKCPSPRPSQERQA